MIKGTQLTNHRPLPWRLGGYTGADWFKFYGFLAGMSFVLCYVYTRYFALFEEVEKQPAWFKTFLVLFAGIPVLLVAIALLGFNWWAGGALTRYSQWQMREPRLWRWFWFIVLSFYMYVLLDPLDKIHPAMSRLGLAPAPNIKVLFDGRFELFQFQWGYALLYWLAWFLIGILHISYVANWWRQFIHGIDRTHRYGASVLTGFRETAAVYNSPPVTNYAPGSGTGPWAAQLASVRGERPRLGAPYINPELPGGRLSPEQARAVLAADRSGAILPGPGQPADGATVLFVDLGRWDYCDALGALSDEQGRPLLCFDGEMPALLSRAAMVVPLYRARQEGTA